ncbi:hypothetical protein C8Q78DRAFT_957978, partial [Trametes maxima]
LLLYDYLLTFNQEVELFWTRRVTGASALFFIIRYLALVNYDILGATLFAPLSDTVCRKTVCGSNRCWMTCALLSKVQFAVQVSQHIPWGAFSALRVLALTRMSWTFSSIVFVLSIGPAVVNFLEYGYGLSGVNVLTTGCQGFDTLTREEGEMCAHSLNVVGEVSIVSRTTLIAADFLVIVTTVIATWKRGTPYTLRRRQPSLGDILLYNGMHLHVLLTLNVLQVVLTHLSVSSVPFGSLIRAEAEWASTRMQTLIPRRAHSLTAIFVYRFLLDLQAANHASAGMGSHTYESFANDESLRFTTRLFGSLGGSTRRDSEWASVSIDQ